VTRSVYQLEPISADPRSQTYVDTRAEES
jgi:hypothetical protein